MIVVENLLCLLDVEIIFGVFAPRQIDELVEIGPDQRGFG